jgi:transcriptional antiterminator NusG
MKKWYVVQVYAGCEELVEKDLVNQIKQQGMQDFFGEILVPSVRVKELVPAPDSKDQRLFPGYVLVETELVPDAIRLINSSPRVLKFLGGKTPVALTKKEVQKIKSSMEGEVIVPSAGVDWVKGSEVDISEGPFTGFVGIIEEVDEEAEKIKVMVSIFGRLTPVELNFDQIKR